MDITVALDECRAWGRGCSPLEHYSTLGSPKVVRGYYGLSTDQDLTTHTIDGFAALKVTTPHFTPLNQLQ